MPIKEVTERSVSTALRRAIQESGKSLRWLGKRSDIDPHDLSLFVRGLKTLAGPTMDRVLKALRSECVIRKVTKE